MKSVRSLGLFRIGRWCNYTNTWKCAPFQSVLHSLIRVISQILSLCVVYHDTSLSLRAVVFQTRGEKLKQENKTFVAFLSHPWFYYVAKLDLDLEGTWGWAGTTLPVFTLVSISLCRCLYWAFCSYLKDSSVTWGCVFFETQGLHRVKHLSLSFFFF